MENYELYRYSLSDFEDGRTQREQIQTERSVWLVYDRLELNSLNWRTSLSLNRSAHTKYLSSGLIQLGPGYSSLDASLPWICYWIVHSLQLLGNCPDRPTLIKMVNFLNTCQDKNGGFGGGPRQLSHLAPTYAAVNALVTCGITEAYEIIDRKAMYSFLMRLKTPEGSFRMHEDGETDTRAAYCALSVARILGILTDELKQGTGEWLARCQTFEGGMGGEPFNEAHGGYSFCGLAALIILEKTHLIDIKMFLKWLSKRQLRLEGGFQGRTNKLVDGCYSFWQGGLFALIQKYFSKELQLGQRQVLFDSVALQEYILGACQFQKGGLIDKPGKNPDFYHTCYCLSGLSIAQHFGSPAGLSVFGSPENLLLEIDPVHNVDKQKLVAAISYFEKKSNLS
eukprot:TRINITY_DN8172_c0_g1_i1.p1 TRINITY_DN8172_c0_g1~~TRINITY_DN8172_c0_g1_i1.p1  ORF type:complete len:396 (-),score=28.42 TRINITY_DN8172_c0_g1_i1:25-1212(-)